MRKQPTEDRFFNMNIRICKLLFMSQQFDLYTFFFLLPQYMLSTEICRSEFTEL